MAPKIKLYMFSGSAPCRTATLMLEHKGLEYAQVQVVVGPHAFAMPPRGFDTMTVPAMKVDGRPVQGTRVISRALDELQPDPPLFPQDTERRSAVEQAERRGEELQDVARRIVLTAARREPDVFTHVYGQVGALRRPAQRVSRGLVIKLASAGHHATDFVAEEDLRALPARLDEIDAWIADGLLDGPELNAADFQIAPNVALLLRLADLVPHIENRPAARLAQRLAPDDRPPNGAVLPPQWLAPIGAP